MYKLIWNLLLWPFAVLVGLIAGSVAAFWIGDGPDRAVGGAVCGLVAALIWFIGMSALRAMAGR